MTVWTFKTSSDFRNELFPDIAIGGINDLGHIEKSLNGMEFHNGTGCLDAAIDQL